MYDDQIDDLQKLIKEKEPIKREKLETVLNFFKKDFINQEIFGNHILIRNTGDSIRERDFLKLIFDHIIPFVLNYDEYQNKESLEGAELAAKFTKIINNAKSKFQQKNELTGEVGELILFLLLESEGITKLVSKMRLKTDSEMPVLGADAVHVQAKNGEIIFHFGESKMYDNFSGALRSAISSEEGLEGKEEDMEFDIIMKHIDVSKFGNFTEKILDYLDPYFENKENMKQSYPVFIGYDWKILKNLTKRGSTKLTEYLHDEYTKEIEINSKKISEKILKSKIQGNDFTFYVIPFVDVANFRKSFLEML